MRKEVERSQVSRTDFVPCSATPDELPHIAQATWMGHLPIDLRQALRSLAQRPTFCVAAILTLALGVGSITGFFSVIHNVVFRFLPYPEARSLTYFHWKTERGLAHLSSFDAYRFWRDESRSFAALAAYDAQGTGTTLRVGDVAEPVRSLRVSPGYFEVLGINPTIGRTFKRADERSGTAPVVMISHRLWRERFGADPSILGRPVTLGTRTATVVGVMPADFRSFPEADVWLPLPAADFGEKRARLFSVIGRLKNGVSREQAQSEASSLFASYQPVTRGPSTDDGGGVVLTSYKSWIVGDVRRDLLILFGAGGLVFLICCFNLFNLCLTNEVCRAGSTAVRVALGARRRDLVKNAVAEYAVLGLGALVIGAALAASAVPQLMRLSPDGLPRADKVGLGPLEWGFALALGTVAVVFVGSIPLLRLAQLHRNGWYKILVDSRSVVKASTRRLGRTFVTGEVALSLAVLLPAFTMIEAFNHLRSTDPGFQAAGVITFQLPFQAESGEAAGRISRFSDQLAERLGSRGDVVTVATASSLPLETGLNVPIQLAGEPGDRPLSIEYRAVSPEYFVTLGIPVQGRTFGSADHAEAAPVAIVNEAFTRLYPGRSMLEETIWIARDLGELSDRPRQIIGVAGDVRDVALGESPQPTVYVPQAQVPAGMAEVIRQSFPLAGLVKLNGDGLSQADLRDLVRQVDPRQAVIRYRPLNEVLSSSVARERFYAALLGLFAFLTLGMTGLGLYGVASGFVGQCGREIGLRMALGADVGRVLRMVMKESLGLSLKGILLGIPLAFGLHKLIASLIPGFTIDRVSSLAWAGAALGFLALAASALPARRATRIEPAVVLRYE
jgi:predicted permease